MGVTRFIPFHPLNSLNGAIEPKNEKPIAISDRFREQQYLRAVELNYLRSINVGGSVWRPARRDARSKLSWNALIICNAEPYFARTST